MAGAYIWCSTGGIGAATFALWHARVANLDVTRVAFTFVRFYTLAVVAVFAEGHAGYRVGSFHIALLARTSFRSDAFSFATIHRTYWLALSSEKCLLITWQTVTFSWFNTSFVFSASFRTVG